MRNAYLFLAIGIPVLMLFSCSKLGADENNISQALTSKINPIPNIPQCPSGEHWSYTQLKCIANCLPPYQQNSQGDCILPNPPFPYTGAQLVSGIFFFQGGVASNIPYYASFLNQIAKFNTAQLDSMNNFISQITAKMNSLSPNFANRFKSNIQASNPDSITANMDEGAGLILSAIALTSYNQASTNAGNVYNSMNINNYNFNTVGGIDTFLRDYGNRVSNSQSVIIPDKSSCLFFFAVVAVAVWDVAAAVNYGILANVAVVAVVWAAVYAKTKMWGQQPSMAPIPTNFERERLVSDILQYISRGGGGGGGAAAVTLH